MRTLDEDFASHIQSGATTLATCWRITRIDGPVLGFTDHDVALTFDSTEFIPAHGLNGSETASKLGPQVDTSEVIGVVHAEAITESDILLGRYDGAVVETWRVNWRDVAVRQLLRRDTIGEITREDDIFRAELRSAQHALNVPKGKTYQALCNAELGEARCGIDLESGAFKTSTVITAINGRQSVTTNLLAGFADRWFDYGRAIWTSGQRVGKSDRIISQVAHNGETALGLGEPVEDWVSIGDTLTLYAGCDRRFATCQTKFSNIANFRGFPHIPGGDFILRYPRAGGDFNGRPLVK